VTGRAKEPVALASPDFVDAVAVRLLPDGNHISKRARSHEP
jgi:hypothetical protein